MIVADNAIGDRNARFDISTPQNATHRITGSTSTTQERMRQTRRYPVIASATACPRRMGVPRNFGFLLLPNILPEPNRMQKAKNDKAANPLIHLS